MKWLVSLVLLVALTACGGASQQTSTTTPQARAASADVCPGWVPITAPGGTRFAFPTQGSREAHQSDTEFQNGDGDVFYEVFEHFQPAFGSTEVSDRMAIDAALDALGDPSSAVLDEGWRVVSQGADTFLGRAAVVRSIEIEGQILRREVLVRAGGTLVRISTMVRRDRLDTNADALRCFERSIVFAAAPIP